MTMPDWKAIRCPNCGAWTYVGAACMPCLILKLERGDTPTSKD